MRIVATSLFLSNSITFNDMKSILRKYTRASVLFFIAFLLSAGAAVMAQEVEEPEANVEETASEPEAEKLPGDEAGPEAGTEAEEEAPSEEDTRLKAEEADANWRFWMEVDYLGERPYWFRHSFEIIDPPASGKIWITADDNYSLYINGEYIAQDEAEEIDWMHVNEYDVGEFLVLGNNTIAIEVSDVDASRHGLVVGMKYQTVPDIQMQLDRMVERELKLETERLLESERREAAETALREIQRRPPTEQELRDMRTAEKNKLE